MKNSNKADETKYGAYIALGVGIGTALGVAMDNIALGVALGAAFSGMMTFIYEKQMGSDRNEDA